MSGGQQITSGQGTLSVREHGVHADGQAGTVSLVVTLALVGAAITAGQGIASANNSGVVALVGSASTVEQQTIAPSWGQALTGSEATASRGTVLPVTNPSTSGGQAIASAAGSLTPEGSGALTVNITGSEATFGSGIVASGGTLISGSGLTGSQGAYALGWVVSLVGSEFSGSQGTIAAGQDADDTSIASSQGSAGLSASIALVGSESTGAQGALQVTGDVARPLVGEQSASAVGSVGFEQSYALTGLESTGQQYNVGAPGGAALSGAEVSVIAGSVFLTGDRTFAISGEAITAQDGVTFASSLAFPPGQGLTISQQTMGPKNAALSGASVGVVQGTLVAEGGDRATGGVEYAGNSGKPKKRKFLRQIAGQVVAFDTAEQALTAYDPVPTVKPVVTEVPDEPELVVDTEAEDEEALLEMLVMSL